MRTHPQPSKLKAPSWRQVPQQLRPRLRFTPTAWAKLLFLRDLGETEVGGFGISAPDDLLLVEEFVLVPQTCSVVTVSFDDTAVAEFFDRQIDLGRRPEQFGRIWIHTHPGDSARPSGVDEATFARVFGRSDWAVMAIVACGGQTYARLRFQAGSGGLMTLPMDVDFHSRFEGSAHEEWFQEYEACVQFESPLTFPDVPQFQDFPELEEPHCNGRRELQRPAARMVSDDGTFEPRPI